MNLLKSFFFLTSTCFLLAATNCNGNGTDTGNPMDDNYGQCGGNPNPQSKSISTQCMPTPAPEIHAGQTCEKLGACHNIDVKECYDNLMKAPGLDKEIPIKANTFQELFTMYWKEKTVIYDSAHFSKCLNALDTISCTEPIVQNALTVNNGVVDYSNVHTMIHVDPSCQLIYSYR